MIVAAGFLGQGPEGPPVIPMALLAVFGAVVFFAACGLIVSAFGALRRWRTRRRFYR